MYLHHRANLDSVSRYKRKKEKRRAHGQMSGGNIVLVYQTCALCTMLSYKSAFLQGHGNVFCWHISGPFFFIAAIPDLVCLKSKGHTCTCLFVISFVSFERFHY